MYNLQLLYTQVVGYQQEHDQFSSSYLGFCNFKYTFESLPPDILEVKPVILTLYKIFN